MKSVIKLFSIIILFSGLLFTYSCESDVSKNAEPENRKPDILPDYIDVTIPPNIAPMNFSVTEKGSSYTVIATAGSGRNQIKINSSDGIIKFPEKAWKKLLEESIGDTIKIKVFASQKGKKKSEAFNSFYMAVSADKIDPYLVYRLIHPGYYSWSNIKIMQRSVESFSEASIFENQIMDKNCANCHSFNNNSPDRFMIHIRGSLGGTYFVEDGKITRTDPKIDAMPGTATYPSWHPGGRFMAYSSNQVRQSFYSQPGKYIEVFDLVSSLILFDRKNNEIITVTDSDTTNYLQTFPSWSPDGKYLYFCRARQVINSAYPELEQIENTHYDIARKSFDPDTRKFGDTEVIFNAAGISKSASFPRISPDGRFMVFTLHDYGTFPIWHKEADLYLLDMQSGLAEKMNINSDKTESYHTWSSNGKWLVFSSKRIDGRSARPHFAHIDPDGKQGKEFVLPQKDPTLYNRMLESFNIPEFVTGKIKMTPRDFLEASKQSPIKAKPGDALDAAKETNGRKKETVVNGNERLIHE
ncbi:MAG: PD40 domain-containing protein [Bacteroidales bacterium]|nr:PD40 domain-containing protein [Bacteroidales bacterium]